MALAVLVLVAACSEKSAPPAAAALKSFQGEDLRVPATKALPPGPPAGAYDAGIVAVDETRGARLGPVRPAPQQSDSFREQE